MIFHNKQAKKFELMARPAIDPSTNHVAKNKICLKKDFLKIISLRSSDDGSRTKSFPLHDGTICHFLKLLVKQSQILFNDTILGKLLMVQQVAW